MQAAQMPKAHHPFPLREHAVVVSGEIVARAVQVTGIQAETDTVAHAGVDPLSQLCQLGESAAQGGTAPSGTLEQNRDVGNGAKTARVAPGVARQAGGTIVDVVARVRHNPADAEGLAAPELEGESPYGSSA